MKARIAGIAAGALVLAGIAVPAVAYAQDTSTPIYCELATPAVRDVIQDAPAIAAVLNLDPALPDSEIQAKRDAVGCGPAPQQTPEEARAAVCGVLVEAKVDALVAETNNPKADTLLETVRPALPQVLGQARAQLRCDSAPAGSSDVVIPDSTTPDSTTPVDVPQVEDAPSGGVETGWVA